MSRVPFVSYSWKEGRVWDLWMFVHFLSGTTIGFANAYLSLPTTYLFGLCALGMILWEIVEIVGGVHEVAENRLLDVATGLLGLFVASELIMSRVSLDFAQACFYISAALLLLGCYFGWSAYQKRMQGM